MRVASRGRGGRGHLLIVADDHGDGVNDPLRLKDDQVAHPGHVIPARASRGGAVVLTQRCWRGAMAYEAGGMSYLRQGACPI